MELHELVLEMKQIERRLMLYEEKYGILSQDFYDVLKAGKLSRYDEFDETRTDFSRWKGIYETWQRRKTAYSRQLQQGDPADALRVQPVESAHYCLDPPTCSISQQTAFRPNPTPSPRRWSIEFCYRN